MADSNLLEGGLFTTLATAGVKEMYVRDGGAWVPYTPNVNVSGAFQEVDAYVLVGGVWTPVHEK